MAKFKVKWPSGKEEVTVQADCNTVDQFVNLKFGRGFDVKKADIVVTKLVKKQEGTEATTKQE